MKILITGGHPAPAAAVVDRLKSKQNIEVVFVGRKFALTDQTTPSFEYELMVQRQIRFIDISTGKLPRLLSIKTLTDFLKFPAGMRAAIKIIDIEKPELILSFGGYIALPIALAAFWRKIPVFTHEQTLSPGLTNRIISKFAKKIFVSYPQTIKFFNKEKTIVTGNPIRDCVYKKEKKDFKIKTDRPIIYITGGSLGSHSINVLIENILDRLLDKFTLIHQTGDISEFGDFQRLSKKAGSRYIVKKIIYEDELSYIYHISDLVISRSGANTIAELIALKKPSILIPLPWAGAAEQRKNAEFLKNRGVCEIFDQNPGKSDELFDLIKFIIGDVSGYKKNFVRLKDYVFKDSAERILSEIIPQA